MGTGITFGFSGIWFCNMSKQVVLIFGSGASINYFSGVGSLTQNLLGWGDLVEANDDSAQEILNWMKGGGRKNTGVPYYKALFDIAKNGFSEPDEFLNFERLIALSQSLNSFGYSGIQGVDDNLKHLVHSFVEFNAKTKKYKQSFHQILATRACIYILDLLSQEHNVHGENNLKNSKANQFFNEAKDSLALRLYSLNYDVLPEYSSVLWKTGFDDKRDGVAAAFDNFSFFNYGSDDHIFCQLHGSVKNSYPNWENHRNVDFPGGVWRFDSIGDAIKNREGRSASAGQRQDGSLSSTNLMITGSMKADDTSNEPYASYINKLFHDLCTADKLIISGYGGGDFYLNRLLKRSYEYRRKSNRKLGILLIDYSPDSDFTDGEEEMWESWTPSGERHWAKFERILPKELFISMVEKRTPLSWVTNKKLLKIENDIFDESYLSLMGSENTFDTHKNFILDWCKS